MKTARQTTFEQTPTSVGEVAIEIDKMIDQVCKGPMQIEHTPGAVIVKHAGVAQRTIRYGDFTHFKVLLTSLKAIIKAANETNEAFASTAQAVEDCASEVFDVKTEDSDPAQFIIRSSPCLILNGDTTYNRIRFDRRTGKKSKKKSERRPEDDAFVKLVFKDGTPSLELTLASVKEFVYKCDLPPQMIEPLYARIINDKRLIKNAASRPLNTTLMPEYGSLKTQLMMSINLPHPKKLKQEDIDSQFYSMGIYHWLSMIIDGKQRFFAAPTSDNESELFDPKTKVITSLWCGHTHLVVLPSQEIMWCRVEDWSNKYATRVLAKDPSNWIPLDSRDVWTREKISIALAAAKWRK